MKILNRDTTYFPKDCIITIGNFDGLHKGHIHIIDLIKEMSVKKGLKSLIVTFDPHPAQIFNKNLLENHLITSADKKIELLNSTGIDYLYIINFNKEFATISAHSFLKDFLVDTFEPSNIIVGYDHFFGNNKEGSFNLIEHKSVEFGYKALKVDKIQLEGIDVKSESIRSLITQGSVETANKLLGRKFSFYGKVVHGRGVGKTIAFPTANIKVDQESQLLPGNGVYSTEIIIKKNKKSYNSVCNIGVRPTFKDASFKHKSIEVHIFSDKNFNIYEHEIELIFKSRVRDEIKFDNKEDLINQINLDKEYCINNLK